MKLVALAVVALVVGCKDKPKGTPGETTSSSKADGISAAKLFDEQLAKAPPGSFLEYLEVWVNEDGNMRPNSGGMRIVFGKLDAPAPAEGEECPADCVQLEWDWDKRWHESDRVCCYLAPEYRVTKPRCAFTDVRKRGVAATEPMEPDVPSVMKLHRGPEGQAWTFWAAKGPVEVPDDC